MAIVTGTPETRTQHSTVAAVLGVMISVGIPVAIAIIGITTLGWTAISWAGAIVWGIVATMAFTLFMMMGKQMGMTRMDLMDLLGSMFVAPRTSRSRTIGAVIHHVNGAFLAVAWAYGVQLADLPANWSTGLLWGAILWLLALMLMTSIGAVHPAIRHGRQDDPGTAATNFGRMTPMGSLLGHLVYGFVLGILYQTWPLV